MPFVNNKCSGLAARFGLDRAREATGLALDYTADQVLTLAADLYERGDAATTQDAIASSIAALAEGDAFATRGACGDNRHAAWKAAWRAMGEEV